ncbi:hypothetical protein GTA62_14560 [Roseobacter sp. HKCCD9010]|uniref:hypothetical protein n=1 Tax=unclassified Roseobacter TaxID=196798 RepID=UPI0014929A94|nr:MULTISPECIES: hypothetical protein [unclassified Roseobacter]MBF9050668.1 hypothetical protein [Rhodobacterales bacterium HKCCD4356]NNV11914.1 hypothetical protein [Roseobacter sp. HKCCD7357]NNV16927.1 hypothetical protein [Roseobacter sp. HKCCD8768]NNV26156.1 hypothetical protein [Roseobacter sp. HKCCD8192]NNV30648.1 hypothetical protein [Roseobacter sp. HKCCD9061]
MDLEVGTVREIKQIYMRHECHNCGDPATKRVTYLLPNARRNPRSAAYGRDDVSWCADEEVFICGDCPEPQMEGFEWCASFSGERFQHMLHEFVEISRTDTPPEITQEGEKI